MTGPITTAPLPASWDSATNRQDSPASIRKAATQFEALLMGELLKSSRESEGGWMGTDEEDAAAGLSDLSEQQLSQALAANGGLGLAKTISAGLAKTAHVSTDSPQASAPDGTPPR